MTDIDIRIDGCAGRITLNRPDALNALTWEMCRRIDAALIDWADAPEIRLLVIDAVGERAFCAGGDLTEMYRTGMAGDFDYGRRFWADEYRMNRRLFRFPKPVASFLQGHVLGGGVGVGCHGSHRIVCDSSRIAMPECGVGLVPDVGGSYLLGQAPGRLGEYLGATAARMTAGDAIHAGFADYYIPFEDWPTLKQRVCGTGDPALIDAAARPAPASALAADQARIDYHFSGETLDDIVRSLRAERSEENAATLMAFERNSPLAMASAVQIVHRLRGPGATIERALDLEARFTFRSMEHGDFLEGIRALIIDKDKSPKWKHRLGDVNQMDVARMLMPLGADAPTLEDAT